MCSRVAALGYTQSLGESVESAASAFLGGGRSGNLRHETACSVSEIVTTEKRSHFLPMSQRTATNSAAASRWIQVDARGIISRRSTAQIIFCPRFAGLGQVELGGDG